MENCVRPFYRFFNDIRVTNIPTDKLGILGHIVRKPVPIPVNLRYKQIENANFVTCFKKFVSQM